MRFCRRLLDGNTPGGRSTLCVVFVAQPNKAAITCAQSKIGLTCEILLPRGCDAVHRAPLLHHLDTSPIEINIIRDKANLFASLPLCRAASATHDTGVKNQLIADIYPD